MIRNKSLVRMNYLLEKSHPYVFFAPSHFRSNIVDIVYKIIQTYRKNDGETFNDQLNVFEKMLKERCRFDSEYEEKISMYKCFLWSDNSYILDDLVDEEWSNWKKSYKKPSEIDRGKKLGTDSSRRPIYEKPYNEFIKSNDEEERKKIIEKYYFHISKKTVIYYISSYRLYAIRHGDIDKDEKIGTNNNHIEKVSKVIDGEIDKGKKIGKMGKNIIYENVYNELSKVIDNNEKCLKILHKYHPNLRKITYFAYLSKYKSFYFARTK